MQRLILTELVVTVVLTLFVVTTVLFTALALGTMNRMEGLDFGMILKLLPPLIPMALTFSLPFGYLLAVALVYGRLVSDRELVALRIAGVHPRVAAMPALALGGVLSLGGVFLTGWVLPDGALATLVRSSDMVEQFFGQLASHSRAVATSKMRLSFDRYEPGHGGGTGVFRDFELDMRLGEGRPLKLMGQELRLSQGPDGELMIHTPRAYALSSDAGRGSTVESIGPRSMSVGYLEGVGAATDFNDVLGAVRVEVKAQGMPLPDLLYLMARGDTPKVPYRRSSTELHGRLSTALLPFLFAMVSVGIAFQLSPRVRRLTGFLLAFLPILLVHLPLWVAGRSLSDSGRVPAAIGMWVPDAVLAVAGTVLLLRAYRR
ncbi:MAG: LptF/LptG family permease [Planctomycetota bacterium]